LNTCGGDGKGYRDRNREFARPMLDAMVFGILGAALNVYVIVLHFRRLTEFVVIWLATLLNFCVPHLVLTYCDMVEPQLAAKISMFGAISFASYATVWHVLSFLGWLPSERRGDPEDSDYVRRLENVAVSLLLIFTEASIFTVAYVRTKHGSAFAIEWDDARHIDFPQLIALDLFLISGVCVYLMFVLRRYRLLLLGIGAAIAFVAVYKARAHMLPVVIPFLLHVILRGKYVRALIIGVFIALLALGIQAVRYHAIEQVDDIPNAFQDRLFALQEGSGELDTLQAFYYFAERADRYEWIGEAITVRRLLLWFVPTSTGIKPRDETWLLWDEYTGRTGVGGSLPPTLFGVMFVNFSWFGCVLSFGILMFLIMCRRLSRALRVADVVTFGLAGYCSFLMARGFVYNGVLPFVLGVVLLGAITRVTARVNLLRMG
jgi:hypothetical protein